MAGQTDSGKAFEYQLAVELSKFLGGLFVFIIASILIFNIMARVFDW